MCHLKHRIIYGNGNNILPLNFANLFFYPCLTQFRLVLFLKCDFLFFKFLLMIHNKDINLYRSFIKSMWCISCDILTHFNMCPSSVIFMFQVHSSESATLHMIKKMFLIFCLSSTPYSESWNQTTQVVNLYLFLDNINTIIMVLPIMY